MEAGQFPPGQFSSVSGSSSQKDIPTPFSAKNQTIEINGKFFRVKEMMVDGKKVDVSKLKSTDIQQLQSLARQAIQEEHGDTSSYTVSLTDNSAVVNGKEFIPEGQKTLNDVTTLGENLLKTQKQEKKHTFKSRVPSNAKATAIKVGAVALFILTSPLIIAIGLLIGGGVLLKDLGSSIKHAIFETDNLKEAMKEMKTKEEENKFNGLSKVHEKFLKPNDDAILNPIKIEVPHFHQNEKFLQETLQNKAERHINRALMRNSSDIDQTTISNLVKNLEVGDFASENALKTKLFSHMLGLEKVLEDNDIKLLVKEAKIASVNTREQDQKALQELQDALSSIPSDYRAANTRVTNALRAVIESPSYQAIKEDPNNLYVRYVSNISYGLWNSVQVIDEYKEFGKKVLGHVDQAAIQAEGLTAGEQQRKIMEEAHNQTKQQIYTDHGLAEKILYAFTHPAQALGSLNSEGGWHREIASAFGTSTYDPHGKFNNNPSLQGTTSATFANNQKASINNCYGGSPTIGDRYQTTISPEFEAVCQAVENQRFTKQKDPNIPDRIYYTN
ncbi:MAG TPA: hypothetical protein PLC42_02480, partial [Parachlamydiaceae bacterium]|nr:hypothetical protein [Parachlamydiaceae bacterium]